MIIFYIHNNLLFFTDNAAENLFGEVVYREFLHHPLQRMCPELRIKTGFSDLINWVKNGAQINLANAPNQGSPFCLHP